ncbi:MAG: hypothetical protein IT165_06530 [Bryobacterales bacterium]|nr:hypothetical protein [Bryobacterales bacterium]
MRGRQKKLPAKDAQTRRETIGAKDAQNGTEEVVGHQGPETAEEAQLGPDGAQDDPNAVETAQADAGTPGGAATAGVETGTGGVEVAERVQEAGVAGIAAEPEASQTAQPEGETATAKEVPAVDTEAALAMRRFAENPKCACGCGKTLPNPKKHFIIGHDGKAKAILRKVMRGELPADAVPTELILRHREIGFVMRGPEYRKLVESWQKAR